MPSLTLGNCLLLALGSIFDVKAVVAAAQDSRKIINGESLAARWTPDRDGPLFLKRDPNDPSKGEKRLPMCTGASCVWEGAHIKATDESRKEYQASLSRSRTTTPRLTRSSHYSQRSHDATTGPASEETPESTSKSPSRSKSFRKTFSFLNTLFKHDQMSQSQRFDQSEDINVDLQHSLTAPNSPLATSSLYSPRNGEDKPISLTMQGFTSKQEEQKKNSTVKRIVRALDKTTAVALNLLPSTMLQKVKYPQQSSTPGRRRPKRRIRTASIAKPVAEYL